MTANRTDLYAVLGLSPRATKEQIRRAYRTLMRENHPDTRVPSDRGDRGEPGDPARGAAANAALQQAIAAYGVLGDPARRAEYDRRATLGRGTTPTSGGPVVRLSRDTSDQPPIQASPVRWHRGPR